MKKPSKSFEIALSAIACAVAAGFLMLGSLHPMLLATGYLVGMFALMIPLSKGFLWGNALAYLAACLLAMPVSLWKIVPFAVFFGLHPLVNYLQLKYVKHRGWHILWTAVKVAWFDGAMLLSWYVLTAMSGMTFPDWITQYLYLVVFIGGSVFFLAYDVMVFFCQRSVDRIVARIRR